jgi:hypothetical protein
MHTRILILSMYFGSMLASPGDTGIDTAQRYAYGENVGWINAGTTNSLPLTLRFDGTNGTLSGYAWGENIGWVCFPTNGFGGVTLDASGHLAGYAWGENVGWINFPTNGHGGVSINPANGAFSGHAWGVNIGWISFSNATHSVRTVAFDRQGQGTPNWWLTHYGVSESYDAGDGVPAWQKYVMDVDPTNAGNGLAITTITNDGVADVTFTPTSSRRFYSLLRRTDLGPSGSWVAVPAQSRVPGSSGAAQTLRDTNASPNTFFAIHVEE